LRRADRRAVVLKRTCGAGQRIGIPSVGSESKCRERFAGPYEEFLAIDLNTGGQRREDCRGGRLIQTT